MNIIYKSKIVLALLAVMFSGSIAHAVTDFDQIQPFLEDETAAVVSINLDSINTQTVYDELMYYIAEYLDQADADNAATHLNSLKIMLDGYIGQFKNEGVSSINIVVSMYDLPAFYIVVPHKSGSECASVKALVQMLTLTELKNVPFISLDTFENVGDVMFIGNSKTLNRLRVNSNIDRPDIKKAFETVDSYGIKLLYTPSGSLQRVIQETTFPVTQAGDIGTGSDFTDSVQWAAAGLNMKKDIDLTYVAQSKSRDAAAKAMVLIEKIQAHILQNKPWIKQQYPQVDSMLAAIKPDASGSQLTKTINKMQIRKSLAPVMEACFKSAKIQTDIKISMSNLKGIATACAIHMNDHNNQMPGSLEELIKTADYPARGLVSPLEYCGTGYIYRGDDLNGNFNKKDKIIIVFERFEKNCDTYYIVGFMDGHAEYMKADAFQNALEADNTQRRLNKIAEKPE